MIKVAEVSIESKVDLAMANEVLSMESQLDVDNNEVHLLTKHVRSLVFSAKLYTYFEMSSS